MASKTHVIKKIFRCAVHTDTLRPYSHVADTYRSEMNFVVDLPRVDTATMLPATQIGTIPIGSNKWSEEILECFPQSVNNMTQNKEAGRVKVFSPIKIMFNLPICLFLTLLLFVFLAVDTMLLVSGLL